MVQEKYAAKAVEILTAEQKETLSKLKGTEFDVTKITPGGPGGRKGAPALQRESTRQRNGK
jgi:hypothetical protein